MKHTHKSNETHTHTQQTQDGEDRVRQTKLNNFTEIFNKQESNERHGVNQIMFSGDGREGISCHPASQQLSQELLQAYKVSLQPSKTIKNWWFSYVVVMSARSLAVSILGARGTQNDTKWPQNEPRDLPRPPKVDLKSTKSDHSAP